MIREFFRSFQIALSFYTIIPVVKHYDWTKNRIRFMPLMLPVVGMLVGCINLTAFYLVSLTGLQTFSKTFLMLLAMMIVTGGLHHDGLMDVADAVFSRAMSVERRLEIMKDSRVGAFGVMTLFVYMGLYWITLYESIEGINAYAFLIIPILSRMMTGMIFYHFKFAKKNGLAITFGEALVKKDRFIVYLYFVLITTCIMTFIGIHWIALSIVSLVTLLLLRVFAYRAFGGMTGDVFGAYILIVELILFMTVGLI